MPLDTEVGAFSYEDLADLPLDRLKLLKTICAMEADALDGMKIALDRLEAAMAYSPTPKREAFFEREKKKIAAGQEANLANIDKLDHLIAVKTGNVN